MPQNYIEAVRWFLAAAEQGFAAAQHDLGVIYLNGRGVPQDYVFAHMWFNLATAQTSKSADRESAVKDPQLGHRENDGRTNRGGTKTSPRMEAKERQLTSLFSSGPRCERTE